MYAHKKTNLDTRAQAPTAFLHDGPSHVHRAPDLNATCDGTAGANTVCSALRRRRKLIAASPGKAICDAAVGDRLHSGRGASRRRRRPRRGAMGSLSLPRPPRSAFGDDVVSVAAAKDVRYEGAGVFWLVVLLSTKDAGGFCSCLGLRVASGLDLFFLFSVCTGDCRLWSRVRLAVS